MGYPVQKELVDHDGLVLATCNPSTSEAVAGGLPQIKALSHFVSQSAVNSVVVR